MVETETNVEIDTETYNESGYYKKWVVILHNDDKTPYEFVMGILAKYFNKTAQDAKVITEKVHKEGTGVAGIYPKEQAEFRSSETMKLARAFKFPLQLSVEEE